MVTRTLAAKKNMFLSWCVACTDKARSWPAWMSGKSLALKQDCNMFSDCTCANCATVLTEVWFVNAATWHCRHCTATRLVWILHSQEAGTIMQQTAFDSITPFRSWFTIHWISCVLRVGMMESRRLKNTFERLKKLVCLKNLSFWYAAVSFVFHCNCIEPWSLF